MAIALKSEFSVSYGQVVFTQPHMIGKWFVWTDDHVSQGFLWVAGEVSFGLPDHDGIVRLTIETIDVLPPLGVQCLWAIRTPFEVADETLLAGAIHDVQQVRVPSGSYELTFLVMEPGPESGEALAFDLRAYLAPSDRPSFAILKQGSHLTTPTVLTRSAEQGR